MVEYTFVSANIKDLAEEATHSPILHVAMCPLSTKYVIAEIAVLSLNGMLMKHKCGYPGLLHEDDGPNHQPDKEALWHKMIEQMRDAFVLSMIDDMERTPEQTKEMEDGLLLFVQYIDCLWL